MRSDRESNGHALWPSSEAITSSTGPQESGLLKRFLQGHQHPPQTLGICLPQGWLHALPQSTHLVLAGPRTSTETALPDFHRHSLRHGGISLRIVTLWSLHTFPTRVVSLRPAFFEARKSEESPVRLHRHSLRHGGISLRIVTLWSLHTFPTRVVSLRPAFFEARKSEESPVRPVQMFIQSSPDPGRASAFGDSPSTDPGPTTYMASTWPAPTSLQGRLTPSTTPTSFNCITDRDIQPAPIDRVYWRPISVTPQDPCTPGYHPLLRSKVIPPRLHSKMPAPLLCYANWRPLQILPLPRCSVL